MAKRSRKSQTLNLKAIGLKNWPNLSDLALKNQYDNRAVYQQHCFLTSTFDFSLTSLLRLRKQFNQKSLRLKSRQWITY